VTRDLRAQETTKTQERIMKKVLLTTTALVMTAGFAAAEVSMSGTTQVAVSKTTAADGTDGNNTLTTHIDFNVAVSGASDNGITMSAGFGYDAGRQVDAGDFELDAEEGNTATNNGDDEDTTNPNWSTAAPSLTIGYAGYTITADGSGVADYYNGDVNSGELGVAGTMGDVAFGVTTSIGADAGESVSSYSLSYTMGDITASVVGSDNADGATGTDATKATIKYVMGDTTFTASSDDKDGVETVTSVGFSTKMDAVTIGYTAKNTETAGSSVGDNWDASISYTAGALTASYGTDENSVSKISASYDLGGGANLFAVVRSGEDGDGDDQGFQAVGINFAF
jgi:outer membrane protein OmpU